MQSFARVLSRHQFLKELHIYDCRLGDAGIRIIADSLAGNSTMDVLDIRSNNITSVGLADITRIIESTLQIKRMNLNGNDGVFDDEDATRHFVSTLQHTKSSVQELPGIDEDSFPEGGNGAASYASINNSLTRNRQLNRVDLLLSPPSSQQPQQQRKAATMMLKTWHKAIIKFATVPNNSGASAIFKLFTARPQLLEKRLKRPTDAAAADTVSQEQKRRRL